LANDDRTLEHHAREMFERLAAGRVPVSWRLPGFAAEVERVRRQLELLLSRETLAASYAREGVRLAVLGGTDAVPVPVPTLATSLDVAYVVRWIELGEPGQALPPWSELVGDASGTDCASA
jgi:hypothetical protein